MSKSVVLIKKGTDGRKLAYEALTEIAAEEILKKRNQILIKPNITAAMPDSTGVTTHVSIVEGVLQFLADNSIKNAVIGEGGGCDITQAYEKLGFSKVALKYGVPLSDFNKEPEVIVKVQNPLVQDAFGLAKTVTECDCIINVPCLKVHKWESRVTLCLKNMMGCIARNRSIMHRNFNQRLMDLLSVTNKSMVNIIDGIVGLEGDEIHGNPVGVGVIIASRDWVAADAVGAAVMGFSEGEVGHIPLAEQHGFGIGTLANIEVRGASIEAVRKPFKRGRD
ncbi:DUF362 domain-containing protein [Candidatus Poribacteria bacterium]|nr:DUF362 domain-containing protein [Candidatus Poribacteria bacterium]